MKKQSTLTVRSSLATSRENRENKGSGLNVADHYNILINGIYAALETYSNVHRGNGHFSMVTTHLYEKAREIVLEYLGLKKGKYTIIFSSQKRAEYLKAQLKQGSYKILVSKDFGLSLGVYALAVRKSELPKGIPFQTGGGTTKLISREWVIWADGPDRFEAGTPAIINVIAFARALMLIRQYGKDIFRNCNGDRLSANDILHGDEMGKYSGQDLLVKLRQTLIGREILVPTTEGDKPFLNLDNAASTPTFEPIWKTVWQTWMQPEQVQKEIVDQVRIICSDILGAPLDLYDVIFTSNTTEAINLAAEKLSPDTEGDYEPVVVTTFLEHSSNDLPWRKSHFIHLSVDAEGFFDMDELENLLIEYNQKNHYGKRRIMMVAVSGASNVLGVFNDLSEISMIVHRFGARLLVDSAQLVAHRRISMEGSGIDYLAFSAHKVYAPFGCGVLVVKKGLLQFSHSGMEMIRSSGEENTGGIAALGKSLVLLQRIGFDLIRKEEQALTAHALHSLAQIKGLTVYGIKDPDSARFSQKGGVIVFGIKGKISFSIAKQLAKRGGIGVRVGCHCAHIIIKKILNVTPGLERFQRLMQSVIPGMKFPGLVRISLGIENTSEDIDKLIRIFEDIEKKKKDVYSATEVKKQMKEFIMIRSRRVYCKT